MTETRESDGDVEFEPIDGSPHALRYGGKRRNAAPVHTWRQGPRWTHGIAAALLFVLLLGTSVLILDLQRRFPALEPGAYFGIIEELEGPSHIDRFYIERSSERAQLFVVIMRDGWDPQLVDMGESKGSSQSDRPLTVIGKTDKLSFVGIERPGGVFEGEVQSLGRGLTGKWRMQPLFEEALPIPATDLTSWVTLRAELENIDARSAAYDGEITKVREERDKLGEFLGDRAVLRTRAEHRLASERATLEEVRTNLAKAESTSRSLEQRLQLASRVTPMGRLVNLARESLEREARWYDVVLHSLPENRRFSISPNAAPEWGTLLSRIEDAKRLLAQRGEPSLSASTLQEKP